MNRIDSNLRNLFWLAASLVLVVLPHIARLPYWTIALSASAVGWRLYVGYTQRNLPNKWLIVLVAFLSMIGILKTYGMLLGRDSGIALLVLMLGFKLLETKNHRDISVIIFLAYFILLTNFFYSQTISTALYLLFVFLMLNTALINFNLKTAAPNYFERLRISVKLVLQALPLMLVLFILFPRVQGPLWGLPTDAYSGVTGLSDRMSPGSISQLGLSDAIAFRASFKNEIPKPSELYWRGPIFWSFDGRTWSPGLIDETDEISYETTSAPIEYDVTLEPHNQRWLFALDLPALIPNDSIATADFQLLANQPIRNRMQYAMQSHLKYRAEPSINEFELKAGLQLPANSNQRAFDLAQSFKKESRSERQIIQRALAMFNRDDFFYTLNPPLLDTNPVDEFLFGTRRGFCEHYASAFAFLMRAAGIPARIVTGYQGGEINPIGKYMIIRQTDAHAWVEVWLKNEGWVRIDPTAAVAPSRIEIGVSAALPANDPLPLLARKEFDWLRQIRMRFDTVSYAWNQWVLGYNPQKQIQFLNEFGLSDADWRTLIGVLIVGIVILTAGLSMLILRELRPAKKDPAHQLWLKFCNKMAKHGLGRNNWEGPRDYCARLQKTQPQYGELFTSIADLYINLRYGVLIDQVMLKTLDNKIGKVRLNHS
jgi:transglutaminase-like putative cysteine protease